MLMRDQVRLSASNCLSEVDGKDRSVNSSVQVDTQLR